MTTNRTAEGSLYHTLPLLHCFVHLHVAQCRAGLGSPGTGQRSRTGRSNGSLAAPPGARSDGRWGVWGGGGWEGVGTWRLAFVAARRWRLASVSWPA